MGERVDPTRAGRYGIQQYAAIRGVEVWTFATIGCGYERLADALADVDGLPNYRVADRTTGLPVTAADQHVGGALLHLDGTEKTAVAQATGLNAEGLAALGGLSALDSGALDGDR